jgi:hypothetical protein
MGICGCTKNDNITYESTSDQTQEIIEPKFLKDFDNQKLSHTGIKIQPVY